MKHYYFNKNTDNKGNHEIHTEDCSHTPDLHNRTYLGYFYDCKKAIGKAKEQYSDKKFDGCFYCCNDCHTG